MRGSRPPKYNSNLRYSDMEEANKSTTRYSIINANKSWPPTMMKLIALMGVTVACLGFMGTSMSSLSTERKLEKFESTGNYYKIGYYNLNGSKDKRSTQPLPISDYPLNSGSAIATLVSGKPQDIEELQTALKSLEFFKGDTDPNALAPILVFNEGNLREDDIVAIISSTNRPIAFPKVDFQSFPAGFSPEKETVNFRVVGRNPWGYLQMIRFWTTMIWKHPAIQRFDTVMRIDSDSCFKEPNHYLPNFMYDGLYYHSQYVGVEPVHGSNFIAGIYDFVENYMQTVRQPSEARNKLLYHYAESVWKNDQTLPLFRTNFELTKKSFMQRGDVARFNEALTEQEPFGVLRQRWGDAVLRYLTVAMFETPDRVMVTKPDGYFHKQGCSREEVDDALAKYNLTPSMPNIITVKPADTQILDPQPVAETNTFDMDINTGELMKHVESAV